MNDRIKELHDQAFRETSDYYATMQKFAELIVRECAQIIEAQDVDPSFKHRMSWAIKTRFGVE
jgi:hypothetical protein